MYNVTKIKIENLNNMKKDNSVLTREKFESFRKFDLEIGRKLINRLLLIINSFDDLCSNNHRLYFSKAEMEDAYEDYKIEKEAEMLRLGIKEEDLETYVFSPLNKEMVEGRKIYLKVLENSPSLNKNLN